MVGLINNWLEQAKSQKLDNEPTWLQTKRGQALSQLAGLHEPNRKSEFWRYADSNRLFQSITPTKTNRPESTLPDEVKNAEITIVISEDGFNLSGTCPDWLEVKSIDQIVEAEWVNLALNQETVVNLANVALFNSGVSIEVKATVEPVNLVIDYNFADDNVWQYIRNQVQLSEGVHLNITERFTAGRLNLSTIYLVPDQAKLQRLQDFRLTSAQQVVSFNQFEAASQSMITNMTQHLGGAIQHHLHRVNFQGSQAKYISGSINKSFDNNNITDIVEVNHYHKGNQSEVTHRSIAKDKSQIFNNAKALVSPGADQSEIEQDLKNILLSEDAKIFSKPELEVYADEVVAAHGSTIGALDEQSLFYLQSRGIDIEQARGIMIESFEQEAVVC